MPDAGRKNGLVKHCVDAAALSVARSTEKDDFHRIASDYVAYPFDLIRERFHFGYLVRALAFAKDRQRAAEDVLETVEEIARSLLRLAEAA